MSRRKPPPTPAPPKPARIRRLLGVMAILALLAVAANGVWWYLRPRLEELPPLALEKLEPEVAGVIRIARSELDKDPQSAFAWGQLGAVLRAHDLAGEANLCYRNAQRLDPADYRWPYLLAVSLVEEDLDQSLAALRRSAAICGRRSHVRLRLVDALLDRQERPAAAAIVDEVLDDDPTNPRAQLAKARLLLAEGKLEDSLQWAQRSIETAPDKRATRMLLAQLYRRLGKPRDEAAELEALKALPDGITTWDDPDVALVLGQRRDRASRIAASEVQSSATQDADPLAEQSPQNDPVAAVLVLVERKIREKDYQAAEATIREMLPEHADDERLHFQLGVACFFQKRFGDAAEGFRKVIALKPDHIDAHYNLGHSLREAGFKAEARETFAATVRLHPRHAFARTNLAELLLEAGHTAEAREHLEIAVRLAPQDKRAQELLTRARAESSTDGPSAVK